jgi:excisionase family DNA binding protein
MTTDAEQRTATAGVANQPDKLLIRAALANVLMVSVSTVDRMLADGEITPVRLRGKLVRFHLPDVLAELREKAQTSKHAARGRLRWFVHKPIPKRPRQTKCWRGLQ